MANTAGVSFTTGATVNGTATISAGAVTSAVGVTVTVGGNLVDTLGGRWQVANTTFTGGAPSLPTSLVTNATFSGSAVLPNGFALTGNLTATGNLKLNGQTVSVTGNFNTSGGGGVLTMTNALDQLTVGGNVTFDGGYTVGLLTNGVLKVGGAFAQQWDSSYSSFAASGTPWRW